MVGLGIRDRGDSEGVAAGPRDAWYDELFKRRDDELDMDYWKRTRNVTLVGVVINQADKEVAGMRANSVPGVFKVTNDLQVANQQSERN